MVTKKKSSGARPSRRRVAGTEGRHVVERTQTGVRMEKRILKVAKALAEYYEITLGDLLEGVLLHVYEGKTPFGRESLQRIARLKEVYDLDLDARASHRLAEASEERPR